MSHLKKIKFYISPVTSYTNRGYFITHFKELFALDGKEADLSDSDLQRRNAIAKLLSDWGLVELLDDTIIEDTAPISQIKILPFKEKDEWTLVTKYNIGRKKSNFYY